MNQGWSARICLAGMALALSACGGGSGSGSTASGNNGTVASSTTIESRVNTNLGGNPGPVPATGSGPAPDSGTGQTPADGSVQHPGNVSSNTPDNSGGQTPDDTGGHVPDNSGGQTPDTGTGQAPGSSSNPAPMPSCNDTVSGCFDVGQARIAKYKGDKKAAASYTFDDGYDTSFAIASLFESRGLRASFYVIAGLVPENQWTAWKALVAKGHEIGTHSMTHTIDLGDPTLTDAQLKTEITDAQTLINAKLGTMPQVFAFPWHSYTERSRSVALKTHLGIRSPDAGNPFTMAFFDQDHTTTLSQALAGVNAQLTQTVSDGGWYVAAGHGIDGDGWSPVTTKFLEDHLTFATQYASQLWTDTYLNVMRYRKCSAQASALIALTSAQTASIRLGGAIDPVACTDALTVVIPVLGQPAGAVSARTAAGVAVPVKLSGGKLTVDVRPGEEVTVEIARMTMQVNP